MIKADLMNEIAKSAGMENIIDSHDNKLVMDLATATLGQMKDKEIGLAILPWGAIEPHNYHLPYMTDCLLSQVISRDAIAKSSCIVALLPPMYMGQQNPTQTDFPLCIHTRVETQKAIITDIVLSLKHQGITKLLIVNGHGGNSFKGIVRDLAFTHPDFTIMVTDWFAIVPHSVFFENEGEHADELETSVMMHYYPNLVDLSVAGNGASRPFLIDSLNEKTAWLPRNWKATTNDTGIGNPHRSTAEKGAKYAEAVSDKIAKLIKELF